MGVRLAERQDIPDLIKMGEAFVASSPYQNLQIKNMALADWFRNMIHLPRHVIFISEKGMIGGFILDDYRFGISVLQEDFWWCEDGEGSKLMQAFMDWGKENKATHISMASLYGSDDVDGYYKRLGLSPVEVRHFGILK